jgi:preprotein translocase subunit SecA
VRLGRCGRQGDTGIYHQFLAPAAGGPLACFDALFYKAQRKVERRHFHDRKILLYHEKERQKTQRQMGQDLYLDTAG